MDKFKPGQVPASEVAVDHGSLREVLHARRATLGLVHAEKMNRKKKSTKANMYSEYMTYTGRKSYKTTKRTGPRGNGDHCRTASLSSAYYTPSA